MDSDKVLKTIYFPVLHSKSITNDTFSIQVWNCCLIQLIYQFALFAVLCTVKHFWFPVGNNINMLFFISGYNEKHIKLLDIKSTIITIRNGDNGFARVLPSVRPKFCRPLGNEPFTRSKCSSDLDKRTIQTVTTGHRE